MRRRLFLLLLALAATIALSVSTLPQPRAPILAITNGYLSDGQYPNLIVEITVAPGVSASTTALAYLRQSLLHYCHKKSVTILLKQPEAPAPSQNTLLWFPPELAAYVDRHALLHSTGDTAVMHIVYVAGLDMIHPEHAGIAYDNTCIIFQYNVAGEGEERSILLHEAGHLLGLVGFGATPAGDHQDPKHPHHCAGNCVMYWQVRPIDSIDLNPDFCELCRRELTANGGR